jgi:hypothetical protein
LKKLETRRQFKIPSAYRHHCDPTNLPNTKFEFARPAH